MKEVMCLWCLLDRAVQFSQYDAVQVNPHGSSSQALIGEGGSSTKFVRRRRKKGGLGLPSRQTQRAGNPCRMACLISTTQQ
jgi:hypothetical protein